MDLRLNGKKAIITGGSAGIGLACAKELYREGVSVLITSRDGEKLEKAASTIRAIVSTAENDKTPQIITVAADMAKAEDIKSVVEVALKQFNQIDILINNAGSARAGNFLDLPEEAFLEAWNLKLLGYIRMVRAVLPVMIKQRDGRILNIIGAAARTPSPAFLAGSTANAALINFTRGISKELGQNNIRINAISPGLTATARAESLAQQNAAARGISVEQYKTEVTANLPLSRMVDPVEIAAMACLLVSDLSASITGAEILIDSGSTPGV